MKYGYLLKTWQEEGVSIPIILEFNEHIHLLLTGSSGSGKSYALIYLLGMIVKEEDVDITFCDFKNSEDFRFLEGYSRYYPGDAAYDGIISYYKEFTDARQKGIADRQHLLIVDEYPSLISFLKNTCKQKASDIQSAVSEILMLGRGIGYGAWITTQRSDSGLFSSGTAAGGARDNFMVVCSLGRLSKEQRLMLFSGEDVPVDTIYDKGEGLLLADGKELKEVKFPLIDDLGDWKEHIRQGLISSGMKNDV